MAESFNSVSGRSLHDESSNRVASFLRKGQRSLERIRGLADGLRMLWKIFTLYNEVLYKYAGNHNKIPSVLGMATVSWNHSINRSNVAGQQAKEKHVLA